MPVHPLLSTNIPYQLADWLEFYANMMELNVWTNSTVDKLVQDPKTLGWTIDITKGDGTKRTFKPPHVILAIGFAGGAINMPKIPGMVSIIISHSFCYSCCEGSLD